MNDNEKGKRKKAIIGIVLAAIMLASIFAGISASAIANNNTGNESVDDAPVEDANATAAVNESVEEKVVVASPVHGTVKVKRDNESAWRNIANGTTQINYTDILRLEFEAYGEAVNITRLVLKENGTIHGTSGIVDVGVNGSLAEGTDSGVVLAKGVFSGDNGTVTLDLANGTAVYLGTLKDLYVWINTSGGPSPKFALGNSIKIELTSFNATGMASGEELLDADKTFYPAKPVESNEIFGAGGLHAARGASDVPSGTYVDAGVNESGVVIMQLNFTSTGVEGCTMVDVTLTENGSANGSANKDFSAIYLVNDSNQNGVWDRATEPIISTKPTSFGVDNGSVTLTITTTTDSQYKIVGNGTLNYLVAVNTTKSFWSGETLAVNVSAFNATGSISGKYVGMLDPTGGSWEAGEVASDATTGQARIIVTAGESQPSLSYVKSGVNRNLESLQLNFTAIAGKVNITAIMVEQNGTAKTTTYPKIYYDVDKDGNITAKDVALNVSGAIGNLDYNNVTFASNFTDNDTALEGMSPLYLNIINLTNSTTPWWINYSINYTRNDGTFNTTYYNLTNTTVGNRSANFTWFSLTGVMGSDMVTDITNITVVDSYNLVRNDATNLTMGNYSTTKDALLNYTDGIATTFGSPRDWVMVYVSDFSNWTTGDAVAGPWWINFSINYTNSTHTAGQYNTTYFNLTNISATPDGPYEYGGPTTLVAAGTWWPLTASIGADERVTNILNMSNITGDAGTKGVNLAKIDIITAINTTFDIEATRTYRYVEIAANLTVGNATETDAGQESKYVIIAVNTTSAFTGTTQAGVNTSRYGNWSNYIAYDTNFEKRIFNSYNASTAPWWKTITANPRDCWVNVSRGTNQPSANVGIGETMVPVLQLNFTWSAATTKSATVTIDSITISANGTANETNNVTMGLVYDVNGNGIVDPGETLIANSTGTFTSNNGSVKVMPSDLTLTLVDMPGAPTVDYKNILVVVNTTSDSFIYDFNKTLWFNMTDPTMDYSAREGSYIHTDYNTDTIAGEQLYAVGKINVTSGAATPAAAFISSEVNRTYLVLMQLNFSTSNIEPVNVTNLTVTWNGTTGAGKGAPNMTSSIGIIRDVNVDGKYDPADEWLNSTASTTFVNNRTTITGKKVNVTLGVYNSTAGLLTEPGYLVNFTDGTTTKEGTTVYLHVVNITNLTTGTSGDSWCYNISINYTNVTHTGSDYNVTYFNLTNHTDAGWGYQHETDDPNGTWWPLDVRADERVTDVTNITYNTDHDVHNATMEIIATVTPITTLSKGTSTSILVYVNTTHVNITAGDKIAINISRPCSDYNATGLTSGKKLTDYSATEIVSAIMTGRYTGAVSVKGMPLAVNKIVGKEAQSNVTLLGLNFTTKNETMNLNWINVTADGTVWEQNNITHLRLVNDTNNNSIYDVGTDILISLKNEPVNITTNNGTARLEPVTPPEVTGAGFTRILVIANTKGEFEPGQLLNMSLANPQEDYNTTGKYSGQQIKDDLTTAILNTTHNIGKISASRGTNTTATGATPIGEYVNVSILQINFSATYEPINISWINITWQGTANCTMNITGVGVFNDSNANGKIDANEVRLNATTFNATNKTANMQLDPMLNVSKGNYSTAVIYVNTSGNFTFAQTIKVALLNLSANYTAIGVNSSQIITDTSTADIISNVLTGTGELNVSTGVNDTAAWVPDYFNISTKTTDIVVWQLNLTSKYEKLTLNTLTLTESGTAHGVNDISAVKLYYDENSNGTIDAGETAIKSGTLSADNGTVTFSSLAQAIGNNASKNYLVAVDINTTLYDGETLAFNLTNTSVNATGENSSVVVYNNFTTQSSNTTSPVTGVGTIELAKGANQPLTVTNTSYQNYTSVLQLKFTAVNGAINITNITVKENGTAKSGATNDFLNIQVIDDADGDGLYDSGETMYNTTAVIAGDAENGTVVINTSVVGKQLVVNGTMNILIAINTTTPTTGRTVVFEVNQTLGVGYNATGNVSAQIPYSTKNVTSPGTTISNPITIITGFPIILGNGWNLISTPLMPTNNATSTVISDIASNLESVWAYKYNSTKGAMEWLVYTPGAGYDTLNYIDAGWGYWVKMSNADILVIDGTFFPEAGEKIPPEYKVYTGWNLIGYHANANRNASVYLKNLKDSSGTDTWSTLYKYSYGGPYVRILETDTMERGYGYWMSMRTDGIIYP